jgi:putative transposase
MAFGHDEERVRAERARAIGLFRYSLIREAADGRLSTKQRGRIVRALAEREHAGPFGQPVRVSRATIDRWIRDWRRGGFDADRRALVPTPRKAVPRTPADVLDLAVALKKEVPERTAAQIAAILRAHSGWSPDERTLQRNFVRLELTTRPGGQPPQAFGRFEAEAPNQRWTGDALHGPTVNGRKAILFAFLDDHSRLFTGYRWARREDTVRLEAALRTGIASRGIPASIYVDNGSAFVDKQLLRACASLGIRLVHSTPGQPAGRGKIERAFRTVRDQFLVEIGSGRELDDLVQLNTLFAAWVEKVYHRRVHSETGQTPLDRWSVLTPPLPSPAQLREAFLWSEWRTVTKTATVGLHGNTYEVDTALVGRKVELVFDPFDLTTIEVRWHGRSMGNAVPHRIGRHVHAKARPDDTTPPAPTPTPTGIDYLRLVEQQHTAELAERVQYSRLPDEQLPDRHVPCRLLPGTGGDGTGGDGTGGDGTDGDGTDGDGTDGIDEVSV